MRIKELSCPTLDKIIELYVPKEIRDKNFVIAGGFASWLLELHLSGNLNERYFYLHILQYLISVYENGSRENTIGIGKFEDIDLFILEENPLSELKMFNTDNLYPFETKNIESPWWRQKVGWGDQSKVELTPSERKDKMTDYLYKNLEVLGVLSKISMFAYTFDISFNAEYADEIEIPLSVFPFLTDIYIPKISKIKMRLPFQFIKRKYKSIEEIFDGFDYEHNRAAYYNGKLYFAESAKSSFEEKLIFGTEELYSREYDMATTSAIRAFKYNRRYGFEFSDELSDLIAGTFMEASTALEEDTEGTSKPLFSINDTKAMVHDVEYLLFYHEIDEDILDQIKQRQFEKLLSEFKNFIKMKSFKDDYIGMFVCSDNYIIKREIGRLIKDGRCN